MAPSSDRDRNSLAQSYLWASRASTIAMSAVVPAGLGWYADQQAGTSPWLLIAGAGLGFVLMLRELIRLTTPPTKRVDRDRNSTDNVVQD